MPAAPPSLPPAAGLGARAGDGCGSHPRSPAPRATRPRYQAGQAAAPSLWPRKGEEEGGERWQKYCRRVGSPGSWRGAITQRPLSARCYVKGLGRPPGRGRSPRPGPAGIAGHGSRARPIPRRRRPRFASRAVSGPGWCSGLHGRVAHRAGGTDSPRVCSSRAGGPALISHGGACGVRRRPAPTRRAPGLRVRGRAQWDVNRGSVPDCLGCHDPTPPILPARQGHRARCMVPVTPRHSPAAASPALYPPTPAVPAQPWAPVGLTLRSPQPQPSRGSCSVPVVSARCGAALPCWLSRFLLGLLHCRCRLPPELFRVHPAPGPTPVWRLRYS